MRNWLFLLLLLTLPCASWADTEVPFAVLPAQTTLAGSKATQRLLVEAQRNGEHAGDLSAKAVFVSSNPKVATVGTGGVVRAVGDGTAAITAKIGKQRATATVRVTGTHAPFAWSFRNHVLPVLTKAGCNSGACHGAAAGKGGLKLTLRGYDPDADFNVLTRQANSRRVVPGDPEHSLLLLKPTMTFPHSGGKRIVLNSPDYAVLATWIQAGTPRPRPEDPRPQSLEVFPNLSLLQIGDSQQVLVRVLYSDGHSEDVTRWVKFGTSDNSVATVDDFGKVKMMGHGEAAITVWFSSKVAFARVVSPYPSSIPGAVNGSRLPSPLAGERSGVRESLIDPLVAKQLNRLHIPTSPRCSENEFLRRAFLDTAGILPNPTETEAYLADTAPDKRTKLMDKLLSRPETTDYWTYKWCDLFLLSSRKIPAPALNAFYDFIHKSVETNKPWNQFAREILTARGSTLVDH